MSDEPKCRADLMELAKNLRRRLGTLYTLGNVNDPWMADVGYRSKKAYWVAEIFKRFGIQSEVHARHIHYRIISQREPILQTDGTPYVNSFDCFNGLCDAIRDARYLDLIDADVIIDRRNPEPVVNFDGEDDIRAEIEINRGWVSRHDFGGDYRAPSIYVPSAKLAQEPSLGQPFHIEIWIEKSTMHKVLLPLSTKYNINVIPFIGEASATACKRLVDRAVKSGRPVRILHVTDFDPAGRDMPISAAVKIDFFARKSGFPLDIRLEHVVLSEEQCAQYELPRTPIKKTEGRAAAFEAEHGEGGTELDALEALHPGVLREILIEHIERYRDDDIDEELEDAIEEYREALDDAAAFVRARHVVPLAELARRLDAIRNRFEEVRAAAQAARGAIADPARAAYGAIVDPARAIYDAIVAAARRDLDAIVSEADDDLASLVEQADEVQDKIIEGARDEIEAMELPVVAEAETLIAQINEAFNEAVPDPDEFAWPEPAADEWENPLYDSTRGYVEQVDVYRAHRGDDEYVGLAADRFLTKACGLCGLEFATTSKKRIFCSVACRDKSSRKTVKHRRDSHASTAE